MSSINKDTYDFEKLAKSAKDKIKDKLNVDVSVYVYKRKDIEDTYVMLVYLPNSEDDVFKNLIYDMCIKLVTFLDNSDIIINVDVI